MDDVQVARAIAFIGQSWTTTVDTPIFFFSINTSLECKHHIWTKKEKSKVTFLKIENNN
jgi:hypothetical protein